MRVWLQKQKKKEEAKAATQVPPTPVEPTPVAPEVQPVGDVVDKPVESVEEAPKAEGVHDEQITVESGGDADQRSGSDASQLNEVGLCLSASFSSLRTCQSRKQDCDEVASSVCLARINMIVAARASDHGVHFISPHAVTNLHQTSTAPHADETERRGSIASQAMTKSVEPSAADAPTDEQNTTSGSNDGMVGNNPMMMNGMSGQMGYGFPNQPGFNNGMGFGMNGMSNMMGNGNWNGMNSMGMSPYTTYSLYIPLTSIQTLTT
jgi:hypothetical protein